MLNETLIEKIKLKDKEAFKTLFNEYKCKIYNTAFMILHDKQLAEDALQETFIQVYLNIKTLNNYLAFNVWIYRITTNCCLSLINKYNKIPVNFTEDESFNLVNAEDIYLPENILLHKESTKEIAKAIYGLNECHRISIILFYYNDMSIKDIAIIMNCSEGTVKSRLYYGKKYLKDILENPNKI